MKTEDRFTSPSAECPHPEYWHSADDDSAEVEVSQLVAGFVRALQPEVVVETGTAWGQTAEAIGRALRSNGHGHLYTTEPDPDRARSATERVAGLPVTVLAQDSLTFVPPGPVQFAWFDSLPPLRVPEFMALRIHYALGAIVGFHDCAEHHGFRPQVEELVRREYIRAIYLPTPRGVIFGEVLPNARRIE